MKKSYFAMFLALLAHWGYAQKREIQKPARVREIRIPMKPAYWEYDSSAVEFVSYKDTTVARGRNGNPCQVFLKGLGFKNGTIEFDVELAGTGFPGINFRMSPDRKKGENFYIRSFGPVTPQTRTTLQYAAIVDGLSMWDLTDEYQGGALIYQQGWNHVKLVVSGKQMRAYVNEMGQPALSVPELESGIDSGGISLSGNVVFANLILTPDGTEGLDPNPGYNSTFNDTRYIRDWQVTPAVDFPFGKDIVMPLRSMYGKLYSSDLPGAITRWSPITAGPRSMINLSRLYGQVENDRRRLAWLKTTVQSDMAREKVLHLGFSDEVWVFINGQFLYGDKNYFFTPGQKAPEGRCTIDNTTIKIALKQGKNEIMIGLANYFYGWGLIARFDDMDGISIIK